MIEFEDEYDEYDDYDEEREKDRIELAPWCPYCGYDVLLLERPASIEGEKWTIVWSELICPLCYYTTRPTPRHQKIIDKRNELIKEKYGFNDL